MISTDFDANVFQIILIIQALGAAFCAFLVDGVGGGRIVFFFSIAIYYYLLNYPLWKYRFNVSFVAGQSRRCPKVAVIRHCTIN